MKDAVERRVRERLFAISAAVHELELELLESFWEMHQVSTGIKQPTGSRLSRTFLAAVERLTRGYAVALMSLGVSVAWKAAGIRSRIKGGPVRLGLRHSKRTHRRLAEMTYLGYSSRERR